MPKRSGKEFHFTFAHLIRLVIFLGLCYLIISYLNPEVGQELKLPTFKLTLPRDIPSAFNQITSTISNLIQKAPQFIDDTIRQLKKELVTSLYQDIIKSIEKK